MPAIDLLAWNTFGHYFASSYERAIRPTILAVAQSYRPFRHVNLIAEKWLGIKSSKVPRGMSKRQFMGNILAPRIADWIARRLTEQPLIAMFSPTSTPINYVCQVIVNYEFLPDNNVQLYPTKKNPSITGLD